MTPRGRDTPQRAGGGRAFFLLIGREARVAWEGGGGAASPAAVFLSAAALLAFAIGADQERLAAAGPGALAFSFALAALLGFEQLFQGDLEAGAIEPLALGPLPLELVAAAKIIARAVATLMPAALVAPFAAVLLGLPLSAAPVALASALLAGPALVAAGAAPAALAAGRPRGGLLIAVTAPPLMAPAVIFASGALRAAAEGTSAAGALFLLAAAGLAALVIGSLGAAAALRLHLE
jgi:heme exporter protein B